MIHAVAVLVLFAADPIADVKAYVAASRKSEVAALKKQISKVRSLRTTVKRKLQRRRLLDSQLKAAMSPDWIPAMNLASPKVIGRIELVERRPSSQRQWGQVEQVIDGKAFLLRVYVDETRFSGGAIRTTSRRTGTTLYVSGVATSGFVDGKVAVFKGTFLVSTKTYRTVDGATKTVPLLTLADDATLRKILAK